MPAAQRPGKLPALPPWSLYYQKRQVEQALLAGGYQLVESRDFQDPAATVKVYRRD